MKKRYRHQVELFCAVLLCFPAFMLLTSPADAGGMKGKLERCRKKIINGNSNRALDCFSEVMVEGSRDERRIASYFLGMMVAEPAQIPSLAEAARNIKEMEKKPPVETAPATGGAIPVAVFYHRKAPRPAIRAPKQNPASAYQPDKAKKPSAGSKSRMESSQSTSGRLVMLAQKKGKQGKFKVEEISTNLPARVINSGVEVARKPAAPAARAPQVDGSYEIKETPSTLKKTAAKPPGKDAIDASSVDLQEMDRTSDVTITESAAAGAPENPPMVASDSVGQAETSKVALARLKANTGGFTLEDDLAPDAANKAGDFETGEASSDPENAAEEIQPAGVTDVSSVTLQEMDQTPDMRVTESIVTDAPQDPSQTASNSAGRVETRKEALARLKTNTAGFTVEDDLAPELEQELSKERAREVRFVTDGVEIGDDQLSAMGQAAKLLKNKSDKMIVRGLASPDENNPENLSKMRAKIVEHLLKQKFHVPSGRVKAEWGIGVNKQDQRVLMIVETS